MLEGAVCSKPNQAWGDSLQGGMQQWLGQYQQTALVYAQQGYEQIQDYARINFNDYVEANNLTQVFRGAQPNLCSCMFGEANFSCCKVTCMQVQQYLAAPLKVHHASCCTLLLAALEYTLALSEASS